MLRLNIYIFCVSNERIQGVFEIASPKIVTYISYFKRRVSFFEFVESSWRDVSCREWNKHNWFHCKCWDLWYFTSGEFEIPERLLKSVNFMCFCFHWKDIMHHCSPSKIKVIFVLVNINIVTFSKTMHIAAIGWTDYRTKKLPLWYIRW